MVPGAAVRSTPSSTAQYALAPVVAVMGVAVARNWFGTGLAPPTLGVETNLYPLLPELAGVPLLDRLLSIKQAVVVLGTQGAFTAPPRAASAVKPIVG